MKFVCLHNRLRGLIACPQASQLFWSVLYTQQAEGLRRLKNRNHYLLTSACPCSSKQAVTR